MSNQALVDGISKALDAFEGARMSLAQLREVVGSTSSALEAIPYDMLIELRSIEARIAIEQSYEDEDCITNADEVASQLRAWLIRVPL